MSEAQQIEYDTHNVVLLEALGNGCNEKSYEYILSHINATNSPWIKRAGVHALRGYHHTHVSTVKVSKSAKIRNRNLF